MTIELHDSKCKYPRMMLVEVLDDAVSVTYDISGGGGKYDH